MILRAVAAAAEADNRHTGGDRRLDAGSAVLDYNAVAGPSAEPLGRKQEEVGGRLAGGDLDGAEDMRVEYIIYSNSTWGSSG